MAWKTLFAGQPFFTEKHHNFCKYVSEKDTYMGNLGAEIEHFSAFTGFRVILKLFDSMRSS